MASPQASEVSARVATLIERHHRGDRRAAAERLGIEPESLAGLLSGDWQRFSLDAMAALVRGHRISVRWLLGSTIAADVGRAPAKRRRPRSPRERAATL